MTAPLKQAAPPGLTRLEWSAAIAAVIGGAAITMVGASYGLTNVTGVGAGFFPTVAGILVAASGALWLGQLMLARNKTRAEAAQSSDSSDATFESVVQRFDAQDDIDDDGEDVEFPDRAGWARVGIIVASVLSAALVLPVIGYTITMTAMLAVVLLFVSKRPWWVALLVGVGAAVASRLVFEGWLGTELPAASIDFLATLGL